MQLVLSLYVIKSINFFFRPFVLCLEEQCFYTGLFQWNSGHPPFFPPGLETLNYIMYGLQFSFFVFLSIDLFCKAQPKKQIHL